MWEPVRKANEQLAMTAATVGELKEILALIPDDYVLSVIGSKFGILIDKDDETLLFDEIEYLEGLLSEQGVEL